MGRSAFADHPTRTVIFWSRKAACTSLFKTLMQRYPEAQGHTNFFFSGLEWPGALKLIESNGYKSVIVARHPVNRSISCYLNKFCVRHGRSLADPDRLEGFSKDLLVRSHDVIPRSGNRNDLTFEGFLDTIAWEHQNRENPNAATINPHWDTQVPPIFLSKKFNYDTVVHVEDFDTEFGAFCTENGLEYTPAAHNSTPKAKGSAGYLGNIPADELGAQSYDFNSFINRKTLKKIYDIYEVDFKMFGYDRHPDPSRRRSYLIPKLWRR